MVLLPTDNLIIDDSIVEDNIENEHHQNDGSFESKKDCCRSSAPQIRYPDCYGITWLIRRFSSL
jgi:glutamine phosphoribosylpyrophosphate amidotransferase